MIRRCVTMDSYSRSCSYSCSFLSRNSLWRDPRYWMLDPGYEPRPTTAATMSGVFARKICRFGPVSLPGVSCNRSHSRPTVRPRSRDDNCGANARLLPTRDQNIFPNRDALLPMEDHKNKFPPNVLRPSHRHTPSACRIRIRRLRLTQDRACHPQSPWPTRPRGSTSPGLSPDNASQTLYAALAVSNSA